MADLSAITDNERRARGASFRLAVPHRPNADWKAWTQPFGCWRWLGPGVGPLHCGQARRSRRFGLPLLLDGVELRHQLSVRSPGSDELIAAFLELPAETDDLLLVVGELLLEAADVVWCA
jgi:hypothetical protein